MKTCNDCKWKGGCIAVPDGKWSACGMFEEKDTAEQYEPVSARWVWSIDVRCSNCNYKLQTTGLPSRCPNCGARMVEE